MNRNLVLSIVAIAALIAAATFLALNPSANGAGSTKSQVAFTLIASRTGYNGSVNMGTPWPVMTVHQGQTVTVHVKNEDPVEPHGFTVTHYFDSGVTLRPGETYTITFVADQKGTFRVYCDIFCTIHVYMQNGQLTVE